MTDFDILNQDFLQVMAQMTELTDNLASSNFAEATARTASDNYNRQLINNLSLRIPILFDTLKQLITSIDTSNFQTTAATDLALTTMQGQIDGLPSIYKAFAVRATPNGSGGYTYACTVGGITVTKVAGGFDFVFNVIRPSYVVIPSGSFTGTVGGNPTTNIPVLTNQVETGFSIRGLNMDTVTQLNSLNVIITSQV